MSIYENIVLIFGLIRTVFLSSYKNVALIFALVRTAFLFFVLAKTVDCKNNLNNYKTQKISIGTIIMNSEMIRFVPDHLKTK